MRNFVLHEKLFLYNLLSQSHRIKYLTIDFPFMSLCVPIVVIYSHRNSIILRTNTALYGYLHFSTLAWKIPWTEEPGRLRSMGSQRVGHILSNFTFTFHFHALEKEMATQSSVLAWRIPGMAEPGGLPSMGSHRVGHNWRDLAAAAASIV